jgi:hypothetical protein
VILNLSKAYYVDKKIDYQATLEEINQISTNDQKFLLEYIATLKKMVLKSEGRTALRDEPGQKRENIEICKDLLRRVLDLNFTQSGFRRDKDGAPIDKNGNLLDFEENPIFKK